MSRRIQNGLATAEDSGWGLRPEQRLCLAILEEGIETLRKHGRKDEQRSRRLVAEVLGWMEHPDDGQYLFPFRVVVDNTLGMRVGISAEALARAAKTAFPRWDALHRITLMKLRQADRVVMPRRQVA